MTVREHPRLQGWARARDAHVERERESHVKLGAKKKCGSHA